MPLHASAVATLSAWIAPSADQETLRRRYLDHLAAHRDAVWREGPPVHLTASCFVLDPAAEQVLLTLHRKGRFWVQFGGHCERGDATLADVAAREAREESGIGSLRSLPGPADLDAHLLPPQFGSCREHLDVGFVALAPAGSRPVATHESDDVAWWPIDRLPRGAVADLPARLARAVAAVRASQPVG